MKLLILLGFFVLTLYGTEISIISKVKKGNVWNIDYIVKSNKNISKTGLIYKGIDINATLISPPNEKLNTAAMFLLDTSVPLKIDFEKGMKQSIEEIFSLKHGWDKWAIAGFSDDMKIYLDYNETDVANSLSKIVVKGQRTELYRAALTAIKSLQKQHATRKFLFLFSDGDAEDNAYSYEEVIKKAKEEKITIIGFGYRNSIHLQSLRRMSEDTGGELLIADVSNHKLPQGYLEKLNKTLNSTFRIKFDAKTLEKNTKGMTNITLQVSFDDNSSTSKKIFLEVEKAQEQIIDYFLLYIIIGLIVLFGVFVVFRRKSRNNSNQKQAPQPLAYFLSASGVKQYIYKQHNSIGALDDNDIVIDGEYISRHHAILDVKDGAFYIVDNNSANKVFVNYQEVSSSELHDGDTVSFGPYEVVFKIIKKGASDADK